MASFLESTIEALNERACSLEKIDVDKIFTKQDVVSTDVDNDLFNIDKLTFQSNKKVVDDLFEKELSKMTLEKLREKCRENKLKGSISTMTKPMLISLLHSEFENIWNNLTLRSKDYVKTLGKSIQLKNLAAMKKEDIVVKIMTFNADCCQCAFVKEILDSTCVKAVPVPVPIDSILSEPFVPSAIPLQELTTLKNKKREKTEQAEFLEKKLLPVITNGSNKDSLFGKTQITIEEDPTEKPKKKKQSIPKNVKVLVWNNYIGENIISHRCLCCKKSLINITSFDVGHVISEKDGGTLEIGNLRPICSACNSSMGTMNMIEYVKKYGLYIG